MRPPMRQPRPLLRLTGVLLALPFLGSCHLPGINTWQEKEGPTDEQLLELYARVLARVGPSA